MTTGRACVLGGTGFVGKHLVTELARHGYAVCVPTRNRERHRELLVLPGVRLVEANVYDETTLVQLIKGADVVINLVGILNERGATFQQAHVDFPLKVVSACRSAGVSRLLHMSALNADADKGSSRYLRSKGEGENRVHAAADLRVTSLRPSVIFGPDDAFFNRFAKLLNMTPGLFPLACPHARLAPIYVNDVAVAFLHVLQNPASIGGRYDLCGPRTYTLRELVAYTAQLIGYRGRILELGDRASRLQARLLQWWPTQPFTLDNYLSLQTDSTCTTPLQTSLGITATAIEAVVPHYLSTASRQRRLDRWRRRAAR